MQTGYLSIGANLGEREASVLRALRHLEQGEGTIVTKVSSLYETAPVGCPPQPFFINLVAEVKTLLSPPDLLKRIKDIEKKMGRVARQNEPRAIDIDIISLGNSTIREERLILPHPRYFSRRFVLLPLREIAPGYRCPLHGKAISDLISDLGREDEVKLVSGRKLIPV